MKIRKWHKISNNGKLDSECTTEELLKDLGRMARRWRRSCGLPGGADCEQEWANKRADDRVKVCIKELESFIASNISNKGCL